MVRGDAVHEISDKTGGSKGNQNIAAAAGAVGGAIAGNAIQNRVQEGTTYRITVRMENGNLRTVQQTDLAGIREGSYRSEEHTSELQSLMRISYAVFSLKKKQTHK